MPSVWIAKRKTPTGKTRHRVGYQLGGKGSRSRYGGTFNTKREALIRKAWIAGELAALRVPDLKLLAVEQPQAPTFAMAANDWLDDRLDVSDGTKVQNRTSVNRALPIIGDRRVDQLDPHDIAKMVVQLHREGVATGYLRKVVQAVAMTFDHAGVKPNPARDKVIVRMPRGEQEEINPPTADHVVSVYHLLPSKHRLPVLFLDWSGSRVTAGIDHPLVGDYDEQRRRVRLRAATTKTRKALWVDLPDVLAEAIEASIGPREDRDLDARLFASSGGDALRTAIGKACKAAGVPLWSPHDLRHRRISLLHAQGWTWARIGEFVGQRNLSTTANVYTHVLVDETEIDYAELLQVHERDRRVLTPVLPS